MSDVKSKFTLKKPLRMPRRVKGPPITNVKSLFTLRPQYKHFIVGYNTIDLEVLSPHIRSTFGCVMSAAGAILLLIVALAMGSVVQSTVAEDQLYARAGHEVSAEVFQCTMSAEKHTTTSTVFYSFTVAGSTYQGYETLIGTCNTYFAGKMLKALYIDSSPVRARIVDETATSRPLASLGVVGGFSCCILGLMYGVWFLLRNLRRYWRAPRYQAQLNTKGVLITGEIIAVSGHRPRKNLFDYPVRVRYRFETPRKRVFTGYAEANRRDLRDTSLPPVGSPVVVLYAHDRNYEML